ncbi:nucleoside triphosphate pyrophosphohydrolase family protein [Candidatus Kuenenbacteria bacterium]|nr:nucleoside triphosphate pyrophosphohydrolase family protein [Candidatus Kuenenbacteria bacterium]
MIFNEYQKISKKTAIYPQKGANFIYPTLGLVGEAGEVAEKIKKTIRDKNSKIDQKDREELAKELGNVLWYLSQLATELKIPLEKIASLNIKYSGLTHY